MQLDRGGRAVDGGAAFDHVGIERSLGQEVGAFDLGRFVGKAFDKHMADPAPLFLRLGHAGQRRQKPVLGLDHVQVGVEVVGELADHRLGFVLSQQAVVDQDARELRADRLVRQRRHDRRIDAARQPANHAAIADAGSNRGDLLFGEVAELPGSAGPADAADEVGQHRAPSGVCVTSGWNCRP